MEKPIKRNTEDCLFCRNEIIGKSFYSNEKFRAFYNIAPIVPGHSLIVPNAHYESLFELSDDTLSEMMLFSRKVTSVLKSFFDCDGFDWTIQDGVSAGQTVPHLHLHIIPRKLYDLPASIEWYSMIAQSEKLMLDSQQRERLTNSEYVAITARLSKASKTINI
jgi:bis(5'-adenosyl)-triphosphatase